MAEFTGQLAELYGRDKSAGFKDCEDAWIMGFAAALNHIQNPAWKGLPEQTEREIGCRKELLAYWQDRIIKLGGDPSAQPD